ncbi:MAG: 4'-phosphopantetheinyl transferase superfamily protein [Gemmatimonadota bacterium]
MTEGRWSVESSPPAFGGSDEIHVWRAALDSTLPDLERLYSELPNDERAAADRFHFESDRRRYVVAHATFRRLIAGYIAPGELPRYSASFARGPNGKPALAANRLRFNLAHAGGLALFAFALDREVGVDLEVVDATVEVEAIARNFFAAPEQSALLALPPSLRVAGFYHIWTQKEAYLKARGDGVAHGLDHFDVEAVPDRPARLLADRRDPLAAARWKLFTLEPGPGLRGALGVEGAEPVTIRCFECLTA